MRPPVSMMGLFNTASSSLTRVSNQEQLLHRNVQWFRGGLASKAHRRSHHSAIGFISMKEKGRRPSLPPRQPPPSPPAHRELYRGTSLIRKRTPLGPYRRPMPRVLGWSQGGGRFFMGEVPLQLNQTNSRGVCTGRIAREG